VRRDRRAHLSVRARAGAKDIIRPTGRSLAGWIGGGCAAACVEGGARSDRRRRARMVSVQPEICSPNRRSKPAENAGRALRRTYCFVSEQGTHG